MTLDDLAAAVVGLEAKDPEELQRVHAELASLRDSGALSDEAHKVVEDAIRWVGGMVSEGCEDAEQTLAKLNQLVLSLQSMIDTGQDEKADEEEPHPPAGESDAPTSSEPELPPAIPLDDSMEIESDPELLGEFITEAVEHIENSERALLALEVNPEDEEAINAVFRAFHTIKGTSGFLCLNDIQKLAHRAEHLLDRARNNEIQIVGGYADLALESVDMLKEMIGQMEENLGGPPPLPPEKLDDIIVRLEHPEDHGISSDVGDKEEEKEEEVPRIGDILVAEQKMTREEVEQISQDQPDKPLGEAIVDSGVATAKDVAKALRTQQKMAQGSSLVDETVRVSTNRLDNLINMVGELVINNAMIAQNPYILSEKDRTLSRNMSQLGKITRELQDLSISMRMVPLKGLFSKMARLVRDLARKSGKEIEFVTEGTDTEIDRNMVESLNDPLVHMIRNAVDHGIERPEDRRRSEKPQKGTLVLRAYHTAGNVVIELKDDGKGLDRNAILRKAVEKGLVDGDKELTDSEVFKLIFAAGFSTAKQITDISGRGVGMDVVKKNIEAMRGRVEVNSTKGAGSIFSIRIPLTLAIIDGMLLKVGEEHYIVPTLNVNQAFRTEASSVSTVQGRGEMVMLRGSLIPLFRLHRIFKVDAALEEISEGIIIVIEHENQRCALLVDQLLGQQQVVIKSLGKGMGKVDGISGAAILGDGRVGLILDVAGVIQIARSV